MIVVVKITALFSASHICEDEPTCIDDAKRMLMDSLRSSGIAGRIGEECLFEVELQEVVAYKAGA